MQKARTKAEPSSQGMISSYFTAKSPAKGPPKKRPSSPIDLTGDDDSAPVKKARTSLTEASVANTQAGPSRIEARTAELWRYSPSPSPSRPTEQPDALTPAQVAARKARHEAFKKKLLGDNNTLFRRKSERDADVFDVDVQTYHEPSRTTDRVDDSGDDSDSAFRNLRDVFSHNGAKRKSSVKAASKSRSSKKADEEIGPSGQTYTPLEKQVCGHPNGNIVYSKPL